MDKPKTQKTKASVARFMAAVPDETRRKDAKAVDKMLRAVTGQKPAMWGPSIIGYGEYENTTTQGTTPWPKIGFSPRRANLVLYLMPAVLERDPLMKKLGRHKTGKSCLYINKLADVDEEVLRELAARSWKAMSGR